MKTFCDYCGSVIDDTIEKCPNCGAVHDFDYGRCPNCKYEY